MHIILVCFVAKCKANGPCRSDNVCVSKNRMSLKRELFISLCNIDPVIFCRSRNDVSDETQDVERLCISEKTYFGIFEVYPSRTCMCVRASFF